MLIFYIFISPNISQKANKLKDTNKNQLFPFLTNREDTFTIQTTNEERVYTLCQIKEIITCCADATIAPEHSLVTFLHPAFSINQGKDPYDAFRQIIRHLALQRMDNTGLSELNLLDENTCKFFKSELLKYALFLLSALEQREAQLRSQS